MNIIVFPMGDRWIADCCDFPGTPPTGNGNSKYEAVGILMFLIATESAFHKFMREGLTITELKNPLNKAIRGDIYGDGEDCPYEGVEKVWCSHE